MKKRAPAIPKPNRSAAEIEFVLRNANRKRGPELMRELARADEAKALPSDEEAPPKKASRRGRQTEAEAEPRKSWL